jgi:hypothetical protein
MNGNMQWRFWIAIKFEKGDRSFLTRLLTSSTQTLFVQEAQDRPRRQIVIGRAVHSCQKGCFRKLSLGALER